MDRTHDAIYNVTSQDRVEMYPPEWMEGVPSSATASVYDGERSLDDAADFEPTVTVDALSVTVDAASGSNQTDPKKLSYAASTNAVVIGRHYLVENVDTQRELVTPIRVVTNDYLVAEDDLRYVYASGSGSTLKGLRLSFPIDATWAGTESNILNPKTPPYKVVWGYTVDSIVRRHYTYLRLVRQRAKHNITIADITRRWPDAPDQEHRKHRGLALRYAIDDAWGDFRFDVRSEGYEPSQIRDTELIDRIVLTRTMNRLARTGNTPGNRDPELLIAETQKEYEHLFTKVISSLHVGLDEGTEGDATNTPVQRYFFSR